MNTLITTHTNTADGIQARVWLTISGKWMVTYHDTDSGQQIGIFTICVIRDQAEAKAYEFAFGRKGAVSLSV